MKTNTIMMMSAMLVLAVMLTPIAHADSWIISTKKTSMEMKELKGNPIKTGHNQLSWKSDMVRKKPINADNLPYGYLVR